MGTVSCESSMQFERMKMTRENHDVSWILQILSMSVVILALLLSGCGDGADSTDEEQTQTETQTESDTGLSETAQIEADLNETLARLRLGDKSALYDMEFQYFTDDVNFDDYLKKGEIQWAQADTIEYLTVQSINMFREDDSARVKVDVVFVGPTGRESHLPQEMPIYFHNGRWIKPTVSTREHQDKYDGLIRAADSAAAADADL